jgi:3-oxoacyl-[acyl-carrier-protein] synthase II
MRAQTGRRDVVITGMGVVSSLGIGVDPFWNRLVAGESGVRAIAGFDVSGHRIKIGGPPLDFDSESLFSTRDNQRMSLATQMAIVAAKEALGQARLLDAKERDGAAVILGSSMNGVSASEHYYHSYFDTGKISAVSVPKCMTNAPASAVSITYGLHGQMFTVDAACASSTHAIGMAMFLIQSGMQSIVVTGGSDSALSPAVLEGWSSLRVLSECNDDPQHACKPFDLNRDGFVLGEGAGILVLESRDSAEARGVPILAEVLGYGSSSDGKHLTAPCEDGQTRAMTLALANAGLDPTDIDHINAHGTGTALNDKTETRAIKRVFNGCSSSIPVVSIKGAVGHLLGASGAVEGIASALAVIHDCIPPTRNYQAPDPECDLDYVAGGVARRQPVRRVLSNSFAFGGSNACVIVGKAS